MSKYDNIWPQAEGEALKLQRLGYTPQQICTALAKKFFRDPDKYNTVKGWHARTFPDAWPSTDYKGGIKQDQKPIRRQPDPQTGMQYQQQTGNFPQNPSRILASQHQEPNFKLAQNGDVRQMSASSKSPRRQQNSLQQQEYNDLPPPPSAATGDTYYPEHTRQYDTAGSISPFLPNHFHSQYQLGELFPDLAEHSPGMESFEDTDSLDGGLILSFDEEQLNTRENEKATRPDLTSHNQSSNPLSNENYQSVVQFPSHPLAIASRNLQAYPAPNIQRPDCSLEGQHETEQPYAKYCGIKPTYGKPNPAPQYPLPPLPAKKSGVVHQRHLEKSCRPIELNEKDMTKVDPNAFPTDHRRKRVKGHDGREFRDSIALWNWQHNTPNPALQGSPAETMQIETTRNPAVIYHDRPLKGPVRSDLRDSGYASVFDSAVDSMRSSFSSLNLADDFNFKTDYREADDGYVDVEVEAKWRMRRSYLEKLRDAPLNDLSSDNMAAEG